MIPVYLLTSDKYWNSVRVFAHLFNKYWGDWQVVGVGGFSPPPFQLPSNFEFVSLGDQKDYPVEKWSDGLFKFLDIIPHETFVFFFDDYWLIEQVNLELVSRLYDYMNQYPKILKVDLSSDRAGAVPVRSLGNWAGVDLLLSDPASPYHMSLYIGMWRKGLLREVLIPNEDPWQAEIEGTNRLREYGDEIQVIGTRSCPVRITLGNRFGDPTKNYVHEINPNDLKELYSLGYLEETES